MPVSCISLVTVGSAVVRMCCSIDSGQWFCGIDELRLSRYGLQYKLAHIRDQVGGQVGELVIELVIEIIAVEVHGYDFYAHVRLRRALTYKFYSL